LGRLGGREILLPAIDVLRDSRVTESDHTHTFVQFYETFVDARYADEFLEAIWLAEDVKGLVFTG